MKVVKIPSTVYGQMLIRSLMGMEVVSEDFYPSRTKGFGTLHRSLSLSLIG